MPMEYIPLLVAILGAFGAVATYSYQRFVDRRTALIELRRSAYRQYLNAFMAMSDAPERVEDIRRNYYQSEVELLIVGSDNVVKKVGALSKFYADTNDDRFNRDVTEVRRLVADICKEMRADCFEKTDLATEEIQRLVPIV